MRILIVVLENTPELNLEIHEADPDPEEQAGQEVVDAQRQRHHFVDFLRRRPAEGGDVLLGHHRVVELVGLVIEFDDGAGQGHALFEAEAFAKRARHDVAHHNLDAG